MIALAILNIFILIGLIGVMYKIDYIIQELEKLTGSKEKKTFQELLKEIQKKRDEA